MKVLLFFVLLISIYAQADDIFDVAESYNKTKKTVFSLETTKREMLSTVYSLERKTKKIVEEKSELNTKKLGLESSLKKTSERIVVIEKDLQGMTPQLQKRLGFVKKMESLPWLYAFISSYNVSDLDRISRIFKTMNKKEADMTVSYFNKLGELKRKKAELKRIASEMLALSKDVEEKEKALKGQHLKKKKLLNKIEASIVKNKKNLEKIKRKGKKMLQASEFDNLAILFGTTFFDKKGELPHPIEASVIHGFGLNSFLMRDHVQLFHKGLFYGAEKGTPVTSIAEGRVREVTFVSGLGYVIVIDHGGSYYSIYSNLSKVDVSKDSIVQAQESIAKTGAQHIQFGSGLYFEIRHFSEPENPEHWLKKTKNKIAGQNKKRAEI